MSGGSCNYICYKIEEELVGRMEDPELDDLMADIVKLACSLEWYLSADTGRDTYLKDVKEFKNKWLHGDRNARLKSYIDKELSNTKEKLYLLIGEENDNDKKRSNKRT